jgi:hypothetical protein
MSWDQLTSISAEATGYHEKERTDPPLACPYDGQPLLPAPAGGLFCPLGDYEWPKMRRII